MYYKAMKLKRTDSKSQVYEQMLDKVRIMFDTRYTSEDFDQLKLHNLNADQLFCLLKSENFVENA
jgi:hypothetical protein